MFKVVGLKVAAGREGFEVRRLMFEVVRYWKVLLTLRPSHFRVEKNTWRPAQYF
jgi:hypothetical protein